MTNESLDIPCGICAGRRWQILYQGPIREGAPGESSRHAETIWRCETCAVGFLKGDEVTYEDSTYRERVNGDVSVAGYYALHDEQQLENLAIIAAARLRGQVVADVGCGGGSFLDMIAGIAAQTIAIEPNRAYQEALTEKGHRVYPYAVDAAETWMSKVDTAVSFNVIEHVMDPVAFMKEIHALLKPGGQAVLCTPNTEAWLMALLPGTYDRFFFRRVHRWYFNAQSLTRLAAEAGFAKCRARHYQRYDLSNALLWARDGRPTGNGKEPLLKDLDALYKQTLETQGRADYIYLFLNK